MRALTRFIELATVTGVLFIAEQNFADQGGPDSYGYVWVDSDEPDGPTYEWVSISDVGTTPGYGDDVNFGPFALGFPFSFYGADYDSVRICTNGFLSFTSNSASFSNVGIPNENEPNTLIAPMWDDLLMPDYAYDGLMYFADSVRQRFIVRWSYTWPEPWYLFEVILNADGSLIFQYNYVTGGSQGCTIGIENGEGTDGLQVAHDEVYLHDHMAVRFEDQNRVTDLTVRRTGSHIVLRWTPTGVSAYNVYPSDDGIHFMNPPFVVSSPPCTLVGEVEDHAQRFYMVRTVP